MIPDLEQVPRGWRIKTEDGFHVEVRPMLYLFRLVEVPVPEPRDTGRFWCYATFEAAVLAGQAWAVSVDSEPVGWVRRGGASAAGR